MLKQLKPSAERNPGAGATGVEFNAMLARAHEIFPSAVIGEIGKVEGSVVA
jgi:hypothetical protein